MRSRDRIHVTEGFCILWALLILVLPLRILLGAAVAAVFHELCHALAVGLAGGRILGLTLGAEGLTMEVTDLKGGRELVCALAGPAGSLLLSAAPIPEIAVCAFLQGCFNLIPLAPLDGGRALGCALELAVPGYKDRIQRTVEAVVLTGLLVLIPVSGLGMGALGAWMLLAMRKFPCKQGRKAVQ